MIVRLTNSGATFNLMDMLGITREPRQTLITLMLRWQICIWQKQGQIYYKQAYAILIYLADILY